MEPLLRLRLVDDGRAAPDVTAGDGIYSAFVVVDGDQVFKGNEINHASVVVTAVNGGAARVPISSKSRKGTFSIIFFGQKMAEFVRKNIQY